jgi:hypothetical protein
MILYPDGKPNLLNDLVMLVCNMCSFGFGSKSHLIRDFVERNCSCETNGGG